MNRHPHAHESLPTCTCLTILNHSIGLIQTLQIADDDQMEMSSPVTPVNPYKTPKVKRMAADAELSSGTGLEPCPFEPCPFE